MHRPLRISILILALLGAGSVLATELLRPVKGWEKKAAVESAARMAALAAVPNSVAGWPPEIGKAFPDVALFDHEGKPFRFETLRGKPVLVEFIAMTCAACQAWSGGHDRGVFDDLAAQEDLESIEKYFRIYTGGMALFDGPVHFVQLIIYDTSLRAPRPEHLAAWREHFGFDRHANVSIVSGGEALANRESFHRIPGFLLLDREGVVRFDALGHAPKHHIYLELLPAVRGLL